MGKAVIVIDDWKLSLFELLLSQAGYKYERGPGVTDDTRTIFVETDDINTLSVLVKTANAEAAKRKPVADVILAEHPPAEPAKTLTDGSPVTPDHLEIDAATGMQKGYVVLSEEERQRGFVRPVRSAYLHKKCGGVTVMSAPIAETYARNPSFYSGTYCASCRNHFPVGPDGDFYWDGTDEKVGT